MVRHEITPDIKIQKVFANDSKNYTSRILVISTPTSKFLAEISKVSEKEGKENQINSSPFDTYIKSWYIDENNIRSTEGVWWRITLSKFKSGLNKIIETEYPNATEVHPHINKTNVNFPFYPKIGLTYLVWVTLLGMLIY